jgi:hypothetical protein
LLLLFFFFFSTNGSARKREEEQQRRSGREEIGESTQAATKPKQWTLAIRSITIAAALFQNRTAADVVVETRVIVIIIRRRCRANDRGFAPIDRRDLGIMEIGGKVGLLRRCSGCFRYGVRWCFVGK